MNLAAALDRLLIRESIAESQMRALAEFPRATLLEELRRRYEDSDSLFVQGNIYDICAQVFGREAEGLVHDMARRPVSNMNFDAFCRALYKCLGSDGFAIATAKLANERPAQLPLTAHALLEFHSKERILDWIESHFASRPDPVVAQWGQLAAIAGMTAERASRWLGTGKPLGLVALDAIRCCCDNRAGTGGWLRQHPPKLAQAEIATMRARLRQYVEADPSPRALATVKAIEECLTKS